MLVEVLHLLKLIIGLFLGQGKTLCMDKSPRATV